MTCVACSVANCEIDYYEMWIQNWKLTDKGFFYGMSDRTSPGYLWSVFLALINLIVIKQIKKVSWQED